MTNWLPDLSDGSGPLYLRLADKIEASIGNARAFLQMREEGIDFGRFIWDFVEGSPIQNRWKGTGDVPTTTPLAASVSKALKARGFKFVGPTIVYAWMQAVGIVNDHITTCFRYKEVERLARRKRRG